MRRRCWSSLVLTLALTGSVAGVAIGAEPVARGAAEEPCALPDNPSADDCLERFALPSGATLPYYGSHSLAGATEVTDVVVVVHGTGRNAQEYFGSIAVPADERPRTAVVAPWFQTDEDDPEDDDAYWTNGDDTSWKIGGGAIEPDGLSSFEVADDLLRALGDKAGFPNLTRITLVGHSAGGQFVQRYAAGGRAPAELLGVDIRFVAANPSSYLYLSPERPVDEDLPDSCPGYDEYKYGLQDLNDYLGAVTADRIREQYIGRRVTYLLGEEDVEQGGSLDTSCAARAQGEHRLERGRAYFSTIEARFPAAPHTELLVPGVGHDHEEMFNSAQGVDAIFG